MSFSNIRALRGEIERQVRVAKNTGKIYIGIRDALRIIKKRKIRGEAAEPKVLVIAENAPDRERLIYYAKVYGIPYVIYPGTSVELGEALERPHPISVITVVDLGSSELDEIAKSIKE